MLIFALVSWWYTTGWVLLVRRAMANIVGVLEFFSIGLLLKSLFAPFRQISVGKVRGPIGVQIRAWGDRQISRAIGAMVRLVVILFGLVATIAMCAVSLAMLLAWPFVPLAPVVAIVILGVR